MPRTTIIAPAAAEQFSDAESRAAHEVEETILAGAPHFHGGPRRDVRAMVGAVAALRDAGLPGPASLVFSQLLLNLAGKTGRRKADDLIAAFLDASDVGEAY